MGCETNLVFGSFDGQKAQMQEEFKELRVSVLNMQQLEVNSVSDMR